MSCMYHSFLNEHCLKQGRKKYFKEQDNNILKVARQKKMAQNKGLLGTLWNF